MLPRLKAILQFMQKYGRIMTAGFAIIWWFMVADFLLLVLSLQFHWFRPFWSAAIGATMLRGLIIASIGLCAWQVFLQAGVIYFGRHREKDEKFWTRLIISAEICPGLILCALWGYKALEGHPSAWPLILLAVVWIIGTLALSVFFFIQARQKRRVRFRLSSGNRPISGK